MDGFIWMRTEDCRETKPENCKDWKIHSGTKPRDWVTDGLEIECGGI